MKTWMNKKTIGGVFLALILLLTFFSKTIYTYHLPEVTAVKPANGKLSKVETGYGTVKWAEGNSIYIPAQGVVDTIYVNEGEYVEAGQVLFSMKYDREENDWKLLEIENTIKRLELEQLDIENRIESAKSPDAEALKAQQSLTEAKKYLEAANALYEIGSVSAQELNETRNEVNYLTLKLKNLTKEKAENAISLQHELDQKKLELENQNILKGPYNKLQEIHRENTVMTAPEGGMVISFPIAKGEKVQKDTLAATLGTGNEYYLECPVSLENNYIITGDTCTLSNPSHQVKGTVSSILPTEQEKIVKIRFTADNVTAGETFEVLFQKESETTYILVPNAAVCQDNDGYYLKQIKRREGMMGKEYYLDRIDIYIGDSDSKHTVVVQGVTFFEPVLLFSDKTAVTGDVVLLKNVGDFFEN